MPPPQYPAMPPHQYLEYPAMPPPQYPAMPPHQYLEYPAMPPHQYPAMPPHQYLEYPAMPPPQYPAMRNQPVTGWLQFEPAITRLYLTYLSTFTKNLSLQ
jgi:hypothetical protein